MDLPAVRRIIRRERDRLKKEKLRKVSPLQVSPWCLKTALCIVAATQGDFTAAVEWLYSPNRRGRPLEASIAQDTTKVEPKKLYEAKAPAEVAQ